MLLKKIRSRFSKENMHQASMRTGIAYQAGMQVGTKRFIGMYDTYRRWSGPIITLLGFYFLFCGNVSLGMFLLAIAHLQILINQVWHKLRSIEYFLEKELQDTKMNRETQK